MQHADNCVRKMVLDGTASMPNVNVETDGSSFVRRSGPELGLGAMLRRVRRIL